MRNKLYTVIFLWLIAAPLFPAPQTPIPTAIPATSTPTPAGIQAVPTPAMTAVEGTPTPLPDPIQAGQKDISTLADQRLDTGSLYDCMIRKDLEDLLREQARDAKLSGNKRKALELLKEIDDLEALRKRKTDQELLLLEKQTKLKQLNLDRVLEHNRELMEKFQADGNQRKVQELNDGIDFINQMKVLLDQRLQLDKELLQARENCDFKATDEIRKKQEDLNTRIEDLDKQTKTKLQLLEERPIPEGRPGLDEKQDL